MLMCWNSWSKTIYAASSALKSEDENYVVKIS